MPRYTIGFSQLGVELEGNTGQELLDAYLRFMNGPQNAFNYFLRNLQIIKDDYIKDVDDKENKE